MDWTWFHQLGQLEFWEGLLTGFEDLGPLVPILLAAVESFFPPLPLVAIVALNVAAHGGVLGFLYSWMGVATGGTYHVPALAAGVQAVFLEAGQPAPASWNGRSSG